MLSLMPLFLVTAFVYAMAGFGGGSTYIALLLLFDVPYTLIPKIALLCNLAVVVGSTWRYSHAGYFSLRRTLPFIVSSIPMAYVGGSLPISQTVFQWLLAISLAVAAIRLLLAKRAFPGNARLNWQQTWLIGIPVGALLGFLAGLVGIGGGIYLAPVLLFFGWANAKQAAASASVFILVNSLAGLAGQFIKTPVTPELVTVLPLIGAVCIGGWIGSQLGSQRISPVVLQRTTAVLILFVSAQLFWRVT